MMEATRHKAEVETYITTTMSLTWTEHKLLKQRLDIKLSLV